MINLANGLKKKVFSLKNISKKVLFSALLILLLFSLPGKAIETVRPRNPFLRIIFADYVFHMVCYGELAFVVWRDYGRVKSRALRPTKIFLYCFLYSLFIEIWQIPLPLRSFEGKDLFFNAVGILIALLVTRYCR